MKKLFFSLAAIVALFAASCTTDVTSDVQVGGDEAVVTFAVRTAGIGSRAVDINDGKKATALTYAIYDKDWNHLQTYTASFENGSLVKELSLRLVKNKTYNFVFWAQNPTVGCYTLDFATAGQKPSVSVDYDALVTNNDNYDAFFGQELNLTVSGTVNKTVELRRPFAQINFGTDDLQAAKDLGFDLGQAEVTVTTKTYSKFYLNDGAIDGEQREVTFTKAAAIDKTPADMNLDTKLGTYHWVSMNYILWPNPNVAADASKDLSLSKCEMTVSLTGQEDIVLSVPQAPARRNWRTNLVGSLLTEQGNIKVEIIPEFEDEYNQEYKQWQGDADTTWYADTDTNGNPITEFTLNTAEQLAGLAKLVDEGNTFEGKTIKLDTDVDLSLRNWDPIGDNRTDAAFSGTFDGQNHVIYGAHHTGDDCWDGTVYGSKEGWGLFSLVEEATIKNVDIRNETFGSYTVITGAVAGYAHNTTFENIEISDTKIAGYNWYTGGVVGWASGDCTFKGIDLAPTTAVGTLWDSHGQNVGGIAGGVSSSANIVIEDCTISCVLDVINDVTSNYKWWIYRVAGMIIGNTNTTQGVYQTVVTATATNVTCKNVTVNYGDWMNYHYCQGYWNRGWARVESSDYVTGVDHTQCNHPAGESHYVCIPFNQLFGGGPNGDGHYPIKGLAEFPGVTVNYTYMEVADAGDLNAAIANENLHNIKLSDNAVIEGTIKLNRKVRIFSNGTATIKGRVNISGYGDGSVFEGVKFAINDTDSKVKNSFSGNTYKYPAIVVIYTAGVTFENCEFESSFDKAVCGINYGAHAANKVLTVNNCKFTGDFYAIRSRTLFNITNCEFANYYSGGTLAAVWTWGNGNSWADNVVFKNNKNTSGHDLYSVALSSTNFKYNNMTIDVKGNTSFLPLADGINPACTYEDVTFAPGSETF